MHYIFNKINLVFGFLVSNFTCFDLLASQYYLSLPKETISKANLKVTGAELRGGSRSCVCSYIDMHTHYTLGAVAPFKYLIRTLPVPANVKLKSERTKL